MPRIVKTIKIKEKNYWGRRPKTDLKPTKYYTGQLYMAYYGRNCIQLPKQNL